MKDLAASPSSVPSLICALSRSPLLTWSRPKSRTIQLLMVPFPDPGAPMIRVLALFPLDRLLVTVTDNTDFEVKLVNKLVTRLLVNMMICKERKPSYSIERADDMSSMSVKIKIVNTFATRSKKESISFTRLVWCNFW